MLYRDALMLVLDKPAGLAVHADRRSGDRLAGDRLAGETLTDWLDHLRYGLPRRPEAAHRLDRDTAGCLVLGRHRQALARLGRLFAGSGVEKVYWAAVEGGPDADEGAIDLALAPRSPDPANWLMRTDPAGQPARTRWRVLGRAPGLAWLELRPVTGRTHQLRVHCAAMGWPIRGDRVYGAASGGEALHLLARQIGVPLYPKRPPVVAEAPVPAHMAETLRRLGYAAGPAAAAATS